MAFSYRQVKDLYDVLHSSGVTQTSLPEWSDEMNRMTGTDLYSQGLHDNWIKRSSVGIDKALEAIPGLIPASEALGGAIGGAFGAEEAGRQAGHGLPRMAVNLLPMMAAEALSGGTATLPMLAAYGATGALSGAEAYTQTGSPASGVISGVLNTALPGVVGKAEQGALSFLRNRGIAKGVDEALLPRLSKGPLGQAFNEDGLPTTVQQINRLAPQSVGQSLASFGTGQLAAAGLLGGSEVLQQGFSGEGFQNPFTKDFAVSQAVTQLPFMAMHMAGKLTGKSNRQIADDLDAAIAKTENLLLIKDAKENLAKRTPIEQTPDIPATVASPEERSKSIQEIQTRLAALGAIREELKVDPTPEKMDQLNKVTEQENQQVDDLLTKTGGVGVGLAQTKAEPIHVGVVGTPIAETPKWIKVQLANDDANPPEFKGKVISWSKGTKWQEPKPAGVPNHFIYGMTSDAKYRTEHTPEMEAERAAKYARSQGATPVLTEQKLSLDLDAHRQRLKAIQMLTDSLSTMTSSNEWIQQLSDINAIREDAGYPQLDMADLMKNARERDVRTNLDALRLVGRDTELAMLAEEAAKADRLASLPKEIDLEASLRGRDDPEAKGILALYEELSASPGRRSDVATSGLFWQKAAELETSGKLTEARMRGWTSGDVIAQGTGLKHQTEHSVELAPWKRLEVLAQDDKIAIQMLGERAAAITANEPNEEFVRLFRRLIFTGDLTFDPERIALTAQDGGLADGEVEARDLAAEFLKSPELARWKKGMGGLLLQNEMPKHLAPRERIDAPRIPAGGDFVWGLADFDPATRMLGGKHTLPKSTELTSQQFKQMAGRGKPLADAEVETAKLLVPEAFDARGNVNVKKLYELLPERKPVTSVSYGQEGKVSEAKAELDKMTHDWFDALSRGAQSVVRYYEGYVKRGVSPVESVEKQNQEIKAEYYKELTEDYKLKPEDIARFIELGQKVKSEPPDTSPRATSYYNQISPFDTKQFPVVRVDVALPIERVKDKVDMPEEEQRRLGIRNIRPLGSETETERPLWPPDNLHENLPNTLGWAMVQFVPDPKMGETVAFVGEQQSRWGQTRKSELEAWPKIEDVNSLPPNFRWEHTEGPKTGLKWRIKLVDNTGNWRLAENKSIGIGETKEEALAGYQGFRDKVINGSDERVVAKPHPLLPIQHTLVLKAVIAEAAKRGVMKVVLSDGETAMMTEGHDKQSIPFTKKFASQAEATAYGDKLNGDMYVPYIAKDGILKIDRTGTANWDVVEQKLRRDGFAQEPSQSGGMRLHYDTTLPSAMKKLTGSEGEKWKGGVHKNAKGPSDIRAAFDTPGENDSLGEVVGSPVFKNPDGTPKSSVTGRIYDISGAVKNLEEQGGFTLGEPQRRMSEQQLNDQLGQRFVPDDEHGIQLTQKFTGTGDEVLQRLLPEMDKSDAIIAQRLAERFPEAVKRIQVSLREDAASYAVVTPDMVPHIVITPTDAMLRPTLSGNVFLHELVHGLTIHELSFSPISPRLVEEVDQLRMHVVNQLPKELRTLWQKAIDTKWEDRNKNADANASQKIWLELAPTAKGREILYALISNHEFLANGFSDRLFQNHLRSIKGRGEAKTGWRMFTDWVKGLVGLGDIQGSAFEEFLGLSSRLFQNGEYLATLDNYGRRYFEGLGYNSKDVDSQTRRAASVVQGLGDPKLAKTGDVWADIFAGADTIPDTNSLRGAKKSYDEFLAKGGDEVETLKWITEEMNVDDVNGLMHDAMIDGKDLGDVMDLLPTPASRLLYEQVGQHRDVLDMLTKATSEKNTGLLNVDEPAKLQKLLAGAKARADEFMKNYQRQQDFATALVQLNAVEPSGFLQRHLAPKELEKFVDGAKEGASGIGKWLTNMFRPFGQMVRAIPEAAELGAKAFELQANQRKTFNDTVKPFGVDISSPHINPEPTHESVTQSQKVFTSPKLLNAANQWIFLNNKKGKDKVTSLPENDADVAKVLSKLNDAEKKLVSDIVTKHSMSIQAMQAKTISFMKEISAVHGAGVLGAEIGGKTKDNLVLADGLLQGVLKLNDPLTVWQGQTEVQAVQQKFAANPDAFLNLLKFIQVEAEKIAAHQKYFKDNPAWSTAQRTERFVFDYYKGGTKKKGQASSMAEVHEIVQKRGGKLGEVKDQWKGRDDEPFGFPDMSPEMAQRISEIGENEIAMLKKAGLIESDEEEAIARKSLGTTQVLREGTARASIPGVEAPARLLSQGAEDLPWLWNHISYLQRQSNYWSRALLRAQMRTYLRDPEIAANEELRTSLKTHFDNLLHPDPIAAQNIRKFTTTWFLGYNMATSLINASQPFLTHVAELTAMTGKPVDSYRRVLRSLGEVGGRFVGKKDWATSEHEKLMSDAVRDGEVGIGMFDDEAAANEAIAVRYKQLMMKHKPQTTGQWMGTLAKGYTTGGMWVFEHGERLNSRSALLASFDYYKEQGLSYEDARAKAYEFNHAVNYGGGRAQRPIGAFSGRGAFPRTVAMLGTSLQSYVLGTTFQIARYLQRGFFRPDGITPAEVHAARKAAVQLLGTQLAAAGLLGMPFVSGAVGLLDKLFPNLELNRHLREGVDSFLGSDEQSGGMFTDMAMTGVPSMLGWDLQSRLSMGNTVPGVSEINGFQPENLMGPVANIVRNFVGGVTGWSRGDATASLKFLPPAVAKTVALAQSTLTDGGAIRDYQGRPLEQPTLGEHLGLALGLQPKRLSDQNAAARIVKQADEVQKDRVGRFHQEQAEQVLRGNFGSVRSKLLGKAREDQTYDPVEGVRAIARSAESSHFPRDLRREGNQGTAGSRSSLLASYMNLSGSSQPSEVERLQFRQKIEQGLGLQAPQQSELRIAMLMDQLKQASPEATRAQLRSAAMGQLRRSAPQTLVDVE